MNEDILFEEIFTILDTKGSAEAYKKMLEGYKNIEDPSSQVYNFLYCLASLNGQKEEAIEWLRVSIEDKGFFYRPEVFEDKDLDSIRNEEKFKRLTSISEKRYMEASNESEIKCSFTNKTKSNIALVLHGNQQNNDISRNYWDGVFCSDIQVEYLQSPHIDSYNRFRWKYDFDYSGIILPVLESILWKRYNEKILCGFSSGCNTILRLLLNDSVACDKVIFVAPWIPMIDTQSELLVASLKRKNIQSLIICGENDPAIDRVRRLEKLLKHNQVAVQVNYIHGMGHIYPTDLTNLVNAF